MRDIDIIKDMHKITINLKERFVPFIENSLKEHNIDRTVFVENDIFSIMKTLIFGVEKDSPIKKVDLIKNKNLLKTFFLNLPNIYASLSVIKDIIVQIDEYLWSIDRIMYEKLCKNEKKDEKIFLTEEEIKRFMIVLDMYSQDCTYIRTSISSLKDLIYNTAVIDDRPIDNIINKFNSVPHMKKDTLKRYYFYDVYEIKSGGFKYFNTKDMFFGETNTILRTYNIVMDFLFKDFMSIYNVIDTNFAEIIRLSSAKTK